MLDKYRAATITLGITLLLSFPLSGQQSYVTQFDVYGGYGFLDSPKVNLFENGAAFQIGFRPKTWLTVGFDYGVGVGDLKITPTQLLPALQSQLNTSIQTAILAGLFPPPGSGPLPTSYNYNALYVPAHSRTQTFAFGPELVYRHFSKVTLFLRPVFAGVIHETATPEPQDPIVKALVAGLIPTPTKTDSVGFVGFGGGFDILFGKHVAWRTQADMVYDHLFSDLLQSGRLTARFSCGPAFNFGRNIVK
jgi:hypothetical protein